MSRPSTITEADIERALGLCELLAVIAHASRNVENMADQQGLNMTNSIGTALDLASDIAGDICVVMEQNKTLEAQAYAPPISTGDDPLLDLIVRFNVGWATYVMMPSDAADDFYRHDVGPLLSRMTDACPPATTKAGAEAALRLIVRGNDERSIAGVPAVALAKAALAYLEGGARD